jgi:hypothetical protein
MSLSYVLPSQHQPLACEGPRGLNIVVVRYSIPPDFGTPNPRHMPVVGGILVERKSTSEITSSP